MITREEIAEMVDHLDDLTSEAATVLRRILVTLPDGVEGMDDQSLRSAENIIEALYEGVIDMASPAIRAIMAIFPTNRPTALEPLYCAQCGSKLPSHNHGCAVSNPVRPESVSVE